MVEAILKLIMNQVRMKLIQMMNFSYKYEYIKLNNHSSHKNTFDIYSLLCGPDLISVIFGGITIAALHKACIRRR